MSQGPGHLRILALVTDGYGCGGGIARYNQDLFNAMSRSGHIERITVLPRFSGHLTGVPKEVTQLPANAGRIQYSLQACRIAIMQRNFDFIFCGHIFMAPLAAMLATTIGVPYWLQIHGIEAWCPPNILTRKTVERADRVLVVSRYSRRRVLQWADLGLERMSILNNTVGDEFSPGPKSRALMEQLGLADKRILLTVGRLSASERYKGHDTVIVALPTILRRFPETRYLIVGDGDDRARLTDLAQKTGVQEHVIFAGSVSTAELPDYYRLADLFVMPSTGEGFGIAYLEAMACGTPALGTGLDGSADPLLDGALGICTGGRDIAEAIINVLGSSAPTNDARLALSNTVRRKFGCNTFGTNVQSLLRKHSFSTPDRV